MNKNKKTLMSLNRKEIYQIQRERERLRFTLANCERCFVWREREEYGGKERRQRDANCQC